jgi:hypothetical protein
MKYNVNTTNDTRLNEQYQMPYMRIQQCEHVLLHQIYKVALWHQS